MENTFKVAYPPVLPPNNVEQSAFARGYAVRPYKDGIPTGPWKFAVGKSTDTARKMATRYEEMGMGEMLVVGVSFYASGAIIAVDIPREHAGVERSKGTVSIQDWDKIADVLQEQLKEAGGGVVLPKEPKKKIANGEEKKAGK